MLQRSTAQPGLLSGLLALGEDMLIRHVAQHLGLPDLQALKNSSSQLRSWVLSAPEAVWRAAALHSTAPYHPMLRCGDIRAYLAWRAAGDCAFSAGSSWPSSSVDYAPGAAQELNSMSVFVRTSYDGRLQASSFPDRGQLELRELQSGVTHAFDLPETHQGCGPPDFCSDGTAVALLMLAKRSRQSQPLLGSSAFVVLVTTATAEVRMLELHNLSPVGTIHSAALDWARASNKLSLDVLDRWGRKSAHWVFDETLTLIAHHAGINSYCTWNASGTGLLCSNYGPGDIFASHFWLFYEHSGPAIFGIQPLRGLLQACWGPWLAGTGEVMLAATEGGKLMCSFPCTETEAWTELGTLLTLSPGSTWNCRMRHVAVVHGGLLQIYRLEPGRSSPCCTLSRLKAPSFGPAPIWHSLWMAASCCEPTVAQMCAAALLTAMIWSLSSWSAA